MKKTKGKCSAKFLARMNCEWIHRHRNQHKHKHHRKHKVSHHHKHHRRHRRHHKKHRKFRVGRCVRKTLRRLKRNHKQCKGIKKNFLHKARKHFGILNKYIKNNKHKKNNAVSKEIMKTLRHTALKQILHPITACKTLPKRMRTNASSLLNKHHPKSKSTVSITKKPHHIRLFNRMSHLLLKKKHKSKRHHPHHKSKNGSKTHRKKHHKKHHKKHRGCPCACKGIKRLSHFLVKKLSHHKKKTHTTKEKATVANGVAKLPSTTPLTVSTTYQPKATLSPSYRPNATSSSSATTSPSSSSSSTTRASRVSWVD